MSDNGRCCLLYLSMYRISIIVPASSRQCARVAVHEYCIGHVKYEGERNYTPSFYSSLVTGIRTLCSPNATRDTRSRSKGNYE